MSVVTAWKKFQKDWKNKPFKTVPQIGAVLFFKHFFIFCLLWQQKRTMIKKGIKQTGDEKTDEIN